MFHILTKHLNLNLSISSEILQLHYKIKPLSVWAFTHRQDLVQKCEGLFNRNHEICKVVISHA